MPWQVDDVMTREVITVGVDTPVGQLASLLEREGISGVPVTAATGGVLGFVSQADLLAGVADGERDNPRRGRPKGRAAAVRAGDLMTSPALSIDADASLTRAARTMQARNVRRLLVTGPRGRLLGVVSRGDLLRPYARTDAAVRREVEAVLRRRLWIHPEQVRVQVHAGTATLTGAVGRQSTAGIVTRVVTAVPGVTEVVNRIRYDFDDADLVRSTVNRTTRSAPNRSIRASGAGVAASGSPAAGPSAWRRCRTPGSACPARRGATGRRTPVWLKARANGFREGPGAVPPATRPLCGRRRRHAWR